MKKIKNDFSGVIREKPMPLKVIKETFIQYLTEADKRKWGSISTSILDDIKPLLSKHYLMQIHLFLSFINVLNNEGFNSQYYQS